VLEKVYGVPVLKKIASLLSIVSLFMILVAQIIASNKFMISLGVESKGWFLAFWAIVIIYTAVGGLKAVVATDVIQATFFVGAFLLCFGYIVFSMDTPIASVWHMGLDHEQFAFEPTKLCSWLIMPLLFMVIEQDMGQRCFAAESPQIISKATLWAGGCTLVISVIPVFLGILAKHVGIEIVAGGSVLMTIVTEMTTPVLTAFVACAILAAIISTADSLINAISSNLSQDFGLSFLKHDHIRTSQLLTGGIAITGILFSFYFNNVVDLLIQSYELSVSCLFIPICFALFKKQGSALSATLSIICGIIGFILFRMYPIAIPKEIASVLLSLLGFFIGQLLSYRPGLYVYENK
jgi:SSS family solute:Na+ symporter